jgi:DNA-binding CsgD family transcriptional regulator
MAIMIREDDAAAPRPRLEESIELRLTLVLDGDDLRDAETASCLESLLAHGGGRLRLVGVTRVAPIVPPRPLHVVATTAEPPAFDGGLVDPLTAKEREVLGHLSELLTTEEIATAMFVSINTVRTHVRNILRKLAVRRRNDAVRRARALRLLDA